MKQIEDQFMSQSTLKGFFWKTYGRQVQVHCLELKRRQWPKVPLSCSPVGS